MKRFIRWIGHALGWVAADLVIDQVVKEIRD